MLFRKDTECSWIRVWPEPQNRLAESRRFGKFYKLWWGQLSDGKKKLDSTASQKNDFQSPDRLLDISPLTDDLVDLTQSNGTLYVRTEYQVMYERLEADSKLKATRVVVTGQSGIGKSYFLVYVLLRQLTQGKTTLFSTSDERTFLFDESGIRTMKKEDIEKDYLPKSEDPTDGMSVWSLIDANTSMKPETSQVGNTHNVFAILAASPNPERLKFWNISANLVKRVMDPWGMEELLLLFRQPELTTLSDALRTVYQRPEDVEELVSRAGSCPRDIFLFTRNPEEFYDVIDEEIRSLRTVKNLYGIFESAKWASEQDSASQRRRGYRKPDAPAWTHDTMHVAFKSQAVMRRVVIHHAVRADASAEDMFPAASVNPYSASLLDAVFEMLALRHTSHRGFVGDKLSINRVFGLAYPMELNPTDRFPKRFSHVHSIKATTSTHIVTVDANRSIEYEIEEKSEDSDSINLAPRTNNLSIVPRTLRGRRYYDDIESVNINLATYGNYYYIPKETNNFFDSFFLNTSGDKEVIISVFQMAFVTKVHGASKADGLEILNKLKRRLLSNNPGHSVVFQYVLVTPLGRTVGRQKIYWQMPERVDPGEVYVLYLGLASFSDVEITYEDLFGRKA
ncbi:hypothetical protein EST38_g11376 [Candolleomyces aberdarensis]|uniref:Uncharacterized protein n=1 Tax=Candolleomyces aberdarensis TaxID=2316362 RepID=A0A4Q2D4Z5_9AGAR|nr:hypothetical protein EST38_g11376 [Candolleomyces aberdarensis]